MTTPYVFDGHNDLLLRILRDEVTSEGVAAGLDDGHIDLPRALKGQFGGGLFAIYVPSPYGTDLDRREVRDAEMQKDSYALPLPPPLTEETAVDWCERGFAALSDLEVAGAVRVCRTADEIETTFGTGRMAGCCSAKRPGRGWESPQDSRKLRSGRMRSQRAAVSSMAEANDTRNPADAKASENPTPEGRE